MFFMSKKEALLLITIVVIFVGGFFYYMKYIFKPAPKQPAQVLATNIAMPARTADRNEWLLPEELKEISANVLLDDIHMACIQDNEGIIYIYNLQSKNIEEKIQFAGKGDFEGLAKVQNTWYVLRSDGFLYEVQPQKGKEPVVKTYDLPYDVENNTESLCYDSANNRLLIGVKEKDLREKDKKGIYGFDLKSGKMSSNAVLYIGSSVNADDAEGKDKGDKDSDDKDKGKKKKKDKSEIKPSGIALHPKSGDLYILDGPSSRMFIADAKGNIKSSVQLDKKTFSQPEGLCFNSNGDLYISSEGRKNGQAVIVKM